MCPKHDDVIKWKHFSVLLTLCEGNPLISDGFPSQRALVWSFDVRLNKRLNKPWRRRWLKRHGAQCDVIVMEAAIHDSTTELHATRVWICYKLQGLYSLRGKTCCCKISWSLEAARLNVMMIVSLWNLTGISAVLLPKCLSNFRAIGKI